MLKGSSRPPVLIRRWRSGHLKLFLPPWRGEGPTVSIAVVSLLSGPEFLDFRATVGPSRPSDIHSAPDFRAPVPANDPANDASHVVDPTPVLPATTTVTSEIPSVPSISVQNVNESAPIKLLGSVVDPISALPTTATTASEVPSISVPSTPFHGVGGSEPSKLSSSGVDPAIAKDDKPNWKSTLYAGTKIAIDVVKETSDAFTPLKSVAGGISAVLKYYDVCHYCFSVRSYRSLLNQQAMANRETIGSLVPRMEGLAESLKKPAPNGEVGEIKRREELIR